MATIVPPGGFAGFANMTAVQQRILGSGVRQSSGARGGTRKRRTKRATTATGSRKRRKSNGGKKMKRLVKGSAAAKAFMRKLRAKRK